MAADQSTDTWDPTVYDFDIRPADVDQDGKDAEVLQRARIAVIRTSDRLTFRRCRRRWSWNSHLRGNIGPKQNPAPLWAGTGFHFALEDFHGLRIFPSARVAFEAYAECTKRASRGDARRLPADISELTDLIGGMLEYYERDWLITRDPLKTYVHDGIPQLEVNFRVDLPIDVQRWGYDHAVYSGTLDRVIVDEYDNLWIVEYKTAKTIQTLHYDNDSQISAYCWAGQHLYNRPVSGVIYQQHRKALPAEPKVLANGQLSQDKRQLITHQSLRRSIINVFGAVDKAPGSYRDFLNWKATQEDSWQDMFVRRDKIRRNEHQIQAEGEKILLEVSEMLNPELPLYPNPDRTCAFMCPFHGPCVSIDDGSDFQYELEIMMTERDKEYDRWRKYLPDVIESMNVKALEAANPVKFEV